MRYSPTNENVKPLMITLLLTVISVSCMMFASKTYEYKWFFQLLFICFATAAIQIFLRYVMTKFEYVCEDDSFMIYKSVGKRKILVANIPLIQSTSYIMNKSEFETDKINYEIKATYGYTRNFQTENTYYYIIESNYQNVLIKFEADDEFKNYVNECIDKAVKGKEQNDEI